MANHGDRVNPDVNGVACTAQVRLIELVVFGPPKWNIHQTLLHDGVEPSQQEVETGSFQRSLSSKGTLTSTHHANSPAQLTLAFI